MRYIVVGAGGIGGLQGAWMARNGVDITFVDKWQKHVDAINSNGLFVDGSRGVYRFTVPSVTPNQLSSLEPLEVVIVAVKSHDTRAALEELVPYSTKDTMFVSMQAGMNLPIFEEVVGAERTIGADPNYGGALVDPGHIEAGFPNYIHIGEMDGRLTERLRLLQVALNHFTPTIMTDNITGTVWSKFVYCSQIMATATSDLPSGESLRATEDKLVAGALVRESVMLADALGIELEPFDFFDPTPYRVETADETDGLLLWMEHAWPRHEVFREFSNHDFVKKGSGLSWDIQYRKRKTESAAMMEEMIKEADRIGMEMPLNKKLLSVISEIEAGTRPLSNDNFRTLEAYIEEMGMALPVQGKRFS